MGSGHQMYSPPYFWMVTGMDYITRTPCHLLSSWVKKKLGALALDHTENGMRSRYLCTWLPPCKIILGWLHPLTKSRQPCPCDFLLPGSFQVNSPFPHPFKLGCCPTPSSSFKPHPYFVNNLFIKRSLNYFECVVTCGD